MRILVAPSVQSCCTLSIYVFTVYLFMADITNPDLFVCSCRIWICLDITRFYEEQRQPSSKSAWPGDSQNTVNRTPIAWGGDFDAICTAVCNRRDSSTAPSSPLPLHRAAFGGNYDGFTPIRKSFFDFRWLLAGMWPNRE